MTTWQNTGAFLGATVPAAAERRPRLARWIEQYGLADREKRGRISAGSPLVGKRQVEHRYVFHRGVLVREVGPDGWLRVSIGTPDEMKSFTLALDQVMEEQT